MVVRTTCWRQILEWSWLLDDSSARNEDVELNWGLARAGVKAYQRPALTYYLHPRDTWWELARQMYHYDRGKTQFVRKHPEAMRMGYALPSLALVTAVALVSASFIASGGRAFAVGRGTRREHQA